MGQLPLDIHLSASTQDTLPAMGASAADSYLFGINGAAKRFIDLALAVIVVIFLLPVLLLTALLIRLEGGPIFYRQTRIGRAGKPFQMLKFRSMRVNSDQILNDYLQQNPDAAEEWSIYQKLRDDPRITRIGKFLRASSIDELPQLFNVLRGDMSLVGQRPLLYVQRDAYGVHIAGYERARPGMTGLWQVRGRNKLSFEDRARLGSEYINHWSVLYDLKLILLTIPAVMFSKDAY